jgi:hypothetical protein
MFVKLFEDFNKEDKIEESQKTGDALIDMLSNSMEHYPRPNWRYFVKDAIDAIKAGSKNIEANPERMIPLISLLQDIFNKYWDLEAKKRNDYTAKDWAEWLKKSSHGWVFESIEVNESVYPTSKGGKIENSLRSEEIGRLNLKYKGDIVGTLLVWMKPGYIFGGGGGYDENYWEVGASYTSYPLDRYNGSTGSGVWSSSGYTSKEDAIKAGKEFMKNVKMS